MSSTLDFARNLIRQPSLTPDDAGCQDLIAEALQPAGFKAEFLTYGEVRNVWLRRGQVDPLLVFAGHTDVVPTGPIEQWHYPPFSATVQDGILHGRGAADMKGSLAAMVTACQQFVVNHPNHRGSIALLITSDEEGPANNGTVKVVEMLCDREEIIDWCVVGEPTSREQTGDVIKNGRRGSLGGKLTIQGVQGHVAYPHLADNPIHRAAEIVTRLTAQTWDEGNEFFPPTTFQVSNLNSGTGASNVIPAQAELDFNLRYSPESSIESIKERVNALCQQVWTDYEIDWSRPNLPFQTQPGELVDAASAAIYAVTGLTTDLSTEGGTSDGRFIAPTGAQVIELGPVNRTIHQINEQVAVADLETLAIIYQKILENLLL
ncbi:N-succinyl-L,L-diaminopimelate desuccinylase [hydrothermal vent metagenome]|jgi:succinyl-diaminopimelate desuccinylase|uniref:Succinyl-diaminopimelate desuccinylase n=1 Tax=hydrothermal vent metagenome TaxID=652676 RepID=A0A160TRT9_9ZZZZ|nr:succinyl-diaminopimelate desuccinylase [Gammaproteobacteria bacterium]PDH43073.1 MAG: succinyl-diaminopimelate desuccinylase [Candidatus Thioglobus sp. MED-G25]|tara:strand:+ start:3657 stop:4784 length:1128 start_codon:yes stop_codon:yes gene_type:complete